MRGRSEERGETVARSEGVARSDGFLIVPHGHCGYGQKQWMRGRLPLFSPLPQKGKLIPPDCPPAARVPT